MDSTLRRALALGALVIGIAAPVRADGTLFIGSYPATTSRPTMGVAFGTWSRPVGFDVEFASTVGAASKDDGESGSITANLLVDTPIRIGRARVYGVAGIGLYGESRGPSGSGEVQAVVVGAGLKVPLRNRLKLRLDYRVLSGSAPDGSAGFPKIVHAQRISAGVSVGF
jgi:opacity protein-like surface antigen